MSPERNTVDTGAEALRRENERLRTALAEAEARLAESGHEFLLRDATPLTDERLLCRHAPVDGRVSVIIPSFNARRYLESAVTSVWKQTIDPDRVEIFVIDDGSTDGSLALAERLGMKSPMRMRVLRHPGGLNRGVSASRQLGVQEATGEFVALLDADDTFLPERLEWTTDVLSSDPALVAVCSLGRNIDAKGATIRGHNGTECAGEWRTLGDGLQPPFTFDQLWRVDPIANSSLTFRRAAIEQVGGFPSLMAHQGEDWLLVLKLSQLCPIHCIDHELIEYRHHDAAYTTTYHTMGLREGVRLEVFYHLAWWLLRSPEHQDFGRRFFRREYPRLIADHQRLLPILRECYREGARAAEGRDGIERQVALLVAELESMRRVTRTKLHENKKLRQLLHPTVARPSSRHPFSGHLS